MPALPLGHSAQKGLAICVILRRWPRVDSLVLSYSLFTSGHPVTHSSYSAKDHTCSVANHGLPWLRGWTVPIGLRQDYKMEMGFPYTVETISLRHMFMFGAFEVRFAANNGQGAHMNIILWWLEF